MKLLTKKTPPPVPRRRLDANRQERNDALESGPKLSGPSSRAFRRNQTLTGSRSPQVRSATELSNEVSLRSPRATTHQLRSRRRKLSTYLAGGLIISAALLGLLYQMTDTVRVSLYGQVAPLPKADEERFEGIVESYLQEYPLQRLRMLLKRDQLLSYFYANDAREIASVSDITHDGIGKTHVKLKVREPIASWTIGSTKRFVDGGGVVFARNFFDTPSVKIRDDSGIKSKDESAATAVTSTRFLRFIGQAVNALNTHKVTVTTITIPPNTTRQVDIVTGKTRLIMTIDRPVGQQSEDAARAWKYLATRNRTPSYIDVRVGGKAFYR